MTLEQPNHPKRLDVLEAGHGHLVDQMADMVVSMREVQQCLAKGEARMAAIETEMRANGAIAAEMRDILFTAKGAFRFFSAVGVVMRWVGLLATAATAIYVAAYTITHGGRPPTP